MPGRTRLLAGRTAWPLCLIACAVVLPGAGCGEPEGVEGFDGAIAGDAGDASPEPDAGTADAVAKSPDAEAVQPDAEAVTAFVCHDGSAEYEGIQEAIDAVPVGFTIEVCPGVYVENLVIASKPLTIRSTSGAATTVVDGSASGATVSISGVTDPGVTIEGLTIRNGATDGDGGGLRCASAALTLRDSVVTGNTAAGSGGGAYLEDCSGQVAENTITQNAAVQGGGLAVKDGSVVIQDNEIRANLAASTGEYIGGGGVWLTGAAPLIGNVIADNQSFYDGGGVLVTIGSGDIRQNEVTGNEAGEDGGGIYLLVGSSTIAGNLVSENQAHDDGGGLRVNSGHGAIEDNTFSLNTAADAGGGVKLSHAQSTFERNQVIGNATGAVGGGLELDNDATTVADCHFEGNSAARGAGLHSATAEEALTIRDSTFTGNIASDCGGALTLEDDPFGVYVLHVRMEGNQAPRGAGLCAEDAALGVAGSVLADNTNATSGGGAHLSRVSGVLLNLVVAGNQASAGAGLRIKDSGDLAVTNVIVSGNGEGAGVSVTESTPVWAYNDVHGNSGGNYVGMLDPTGSSGNLSEAPLLASPETGDYHLLGDSPCVDTGDPELEDVLDVSRSDMGAYGGPYGLW